MDPVGDSVLIQDSTVEKTAEWQVSCLYRSRRVGVGFDASDRVNSCIQFTGPDSARNSSTTRTARYHFSRPESPVTHRPLRSEGGRQIPETFC